MAVCDIGKCQNKVKGNNCLVSKPFGIPKRLGFTFAGISIQFSMTVQLNSNNVADLRGS